MKKFLSFVGESFGYKTAPEDVLRAESHLPSEDLAEIRRAFRTRERHGSILSYKDFRHWCGLSNLGENFSHQICEIIDHHKTNYIHYNNFLMYLGDIHPSTVLSMAHGLALAPQGLHHFIQKCIEWNVPTQLDYNKEVESLIAAIEGPTQLRSLESFKDWVEMFPVFLRSVHSMLHGFKEESCRILDMFPKPSLSGQNTKCLLSEVWAWLLASNLSKEWRLCEWELIFNSDLDGRSFNTFLSRIRNRGVTLLVIQDERDYIFGGLASAPWEPNGRFYGDYGGFLFTLYPSFRIYKPSGSNENFQWCGEKFKELPNGVGFGGQMNFFSLFLASDFENGMSHPTITYQTPTLSSNPKFKLRKVSYLPRLIPPHPLPDRVLAY